MNWEKISSINFGRLLPQLVLPLIVFAISVAAVFVYTNSLPTRYSASARIWVQTQSVASQSSDASYLSSPLTNSLTTACEVLKSQAVINAAHDYLVKRLPGTECPEVWQISAGLDAAPVKDSEIVTITHQGGKNAKIEKEIVGAVVDGFYRENNVQTAGNASQSRIHLQQQLKQARDQYKKTREDLRRFKEQNHAVNLEQQVGMELSQQSELEKDIAETKQKIEQGSGKMKYLEKQLGFTAKDVMTIDALAKDDELKSLRTAIAENETKLIDLRTKYQDEHPKMKRILAALDQSKQALAARLKSIIGRSDSQLESAGAASPSEVRDKMVGDIMGIKADEVASTQLLAALESSSKALQSRISVVPEQQTNFDELMRADSVAKENVSSVEQKLQSVSLTESVAMGTSNLQIIDPPSVTDITSNTRSLGIIGSFVLAVLTGAAQLLLDPRIRSPKQVAGILNLPTGGWVPTRPKRGVALSYLTAGLRKLLFQLKTENSTSSGVLVVVSPNAKDGKSTVCFAIAQNLAEMGSRVALIDANFSRPYQHILFDQQASPGLIDCIESQQANQALKYMKPVRPNLALLPAGQHIDDGSISLKDTTAVIEQLRSDFDFVIIDCRASGLTFDGLSLPECEHQLIVVSRLFNTRKTSLKLLAAQLQMHPEITAHSVINDIDAQSIASNLVADAALLGASPIVKQSASASDPSSVATW